MALMTDFLVIGECVADIVRSPAGPDVTHPGGSPANVAYGLARLGHRAALLTQLGDDPSGELIGAHLRSAGVELLSDGQQEVATPTAVVTLDEQGRASYDFDIHWTLRPTEAPAGIGHVHLGSIAAVTEPGSSAVSALAAELRSSATVSYDPNVRADLLGDHGAAVAKVEECVALADVVKASDEDLEWLYPGEPLSDAARRWLGLGPSVVFVTLGGDGALAFTGAGEVRGESVRTEVADTVGAGDSFMSAMLDALAERGLIGAGSRPALGALGAAELAAVLRHAGTAAAVTVSRAGARPPDMAELRAALAG
jgi:fructokinase